MNEFWTSVIVIALIFVFLDKALTAININMAGTYSIEKNPVAKWFFEKYGLMWGTAIYYVISVFTFILAVYLFSQTAGIWFTNNYQIGLYIVMIAYSFVITNNFYFTLRYMGWLG